MNSTPIPSPAKPANGVPSQRGTRVQSAVTRKCKKCGERLALVKFDKCKRGRLGRRSTCRHCMGFDGDKPTPKFTRPLAGQRFIITSAQNATPIEKAFFDTLKVAAEHLNAELVVIPLRYKNPTSVWSTKQESHDWWDEAVTPYLFNTRKKLCPNLVLVGDVKTQPTASSPLTGFESLTGAESCVIGHPKMQLRVVPAPSNRFPKILTTTGACTKRNYTDTKSGKLGAFHHCLGAVMVEVDGKKFHIRQLNADRSDGSFTDLDTHYTSTGVRPAPRAAAVVLGDVHARFTDKRVDQATFGYGGIIETLDPEVVVFHDVHDGYAVNPHHIGNPFISQAKMLGGVGNVRAEVEHCVEFVRSRTKGRKAVLVSSNHDNFLQRWVIRADWKTDPANAAFYLDTAKAMVASTKLGPGGAEYADPFAYWVDQLKGGADIRVLGSNESFRIGDIECGMHGHQGPNGTRGTLKNLGRLGARVITGHTHTPGIEEGHYQVGTSTPLRLEYTGGPSSWLNTHCIVYASGKRSLVTIIDGSWRL